MLTVSPDANQAITQLCAEAELPDTGGMRIARGETTEQGTAVQLALVEEPAGDDLQIPGSASVYVDQALADLLDDKTLDAEIGDGQVTFALRESAGGQEPSMNGSTPV